MKTLQTTQELTLADGSGILIETLGLSDDQVDELLRWQELAADGLPANTWRALCVDLAIFHEHCKRMGRATLPATPQTIEQYLREVGESRKLSTLRRYLASISRWHRIVGAIDPTKADTVRLALRAVTKERKNSSTQAEPLNWQRLKRITEHFNEVTAGDPRGLVKWLRDRALMWLAYDMLARVSELMSLDVDSLVEVKNGLYVVQLDRSKTDQDGEGTAVFVSRRTMGLVRDWIDAVGIDEGPLFRPVNRGGALTRTRSNGDPRLTERSVNRIVKERAKWVLEKHKLKNVSGHSMRVGAAQDLVADNFGGPAVKQAGRWSSDRMPARYTERLQVHRGAMAKLASRQGRM